MLQRGQGHMSTMLACLLLLCLGLFCVPTFRDVQLFKNITTAFWFNVCSALQRKGLSLFVPCVHQSIDAQKSCDSDQPTRLESNKWLRY